VKVCIYGAGAIGGLIGAKLAQAGEDVTLIARGPHLAAIREQGLTVASKVETLTVKPYATDSPEKAGEQDFVIVALKANAVPGVAEQMLPLLGPDTA
jgi:2-dehydropantoate 2-reductase